MKINTLQFTSLKDVSFTFKYSYLTISCDLRELFKNDNSHVKLKNRSIRSKTESKHQHAFFTPLV